MSGNVLVYTNSFPFGVGEQFIETEAPFWGAHWTVAPGEITGVQTRRIAVTVEKRLAVSSDRKIHLSDLAGLALSIEFWRELARKPALVLQPSKLRYLVIFLVLSARLVKALEVIRFAQDEKPWTVYTYWCSWGAHAFSVYRKKRHLPFRLFSRVHRVDLYRHGNSYNYMPLDKKYISDIDQVFSISQDGVDYLESTYGITGKKLKVSRLGIAPKTSLARRSEDGVLRILSVSYVKRVKRIDKMIDVVANIVERGERVQWTHIGSGDLAAEMKKFAAERGVPVTWLGQIDNKDVEAFYRENPVDIFLNTSDSEGIPVSIMEALSFGVPVVATDVGGTSEIVTALVGALVPQDMSAQEVASVVIETGRRNISRDSVAEYQSSFYSTKNYSDFVEAVDRD